MSLDQLKREGHDQSFLEMVEASQDGGVDGRAPGLYSGSMQPWFVGNPQVSTPALDIFGSDSDGGQVFEELHSESFDDPTSHVSTQPVRDDLPISQADYNRAWMRWGILE